MWRQNIQTRAQAAGDRPATALAPDGPEQAARQANDRRGNQVHVMTTGQNVKRKRHTPEQIIEKLQLAEEALRNDRDLREVCKELSISVQTYYRWRNEYGGMEARQVHRLRLLEQENNSLKKLVAELSLEKHILKESLK
jgi:transposase-like protein